MSNLKQANTQVQIHELLATRWSGRAFDPTMSVSKNKILALLEASRWSPSCYGDQPWRYIVFNRFENEAAWKRALSVINEKNAQWAQNAPVLMLIAAANKFSTNNKQNKWAAYDTGASVMSMSIQATAENLMVHQIGGYDEKRAIEIFDIPGDYLTLAMIAIGYSAPADNLPSPFSDMETAPRSRNNIGQHFFLHNWGNSIE